MSQTSLIDPGAIFVADNRREIFSTSHRFLFCLRGAQWKLIHDKRDDSWGLYDLKSDPKEEFNLTRSEPQIFRALRRKLERFEKYGERSKEDKR